MSVIESAKKISTAALDDDWQARLKNRPQRSIKEILKELRQIIEAYEQKYRMTTAEFLPRYANGEFEMDDSYPDYELAHWQGSYEAYHRLCQKVTL